jgi:hypothetical protein
LSTTTGWVLPQGLPVPGRSQLAMSFDSLMVRSVVVPKKLRAVL